MAYVSMNAYDADMRIPEFTGIMQYGDGINADPRTASMAYNMDTKGGVLQPMAVCEALAPVIQNYTIETLACLHRRWYSGPDDRNILIAAAGGQLHYTISGSSSWSQLSLPAGWSGGHYKSNVWSCAAYEINPAGAADPVDILLLSNAQDGMVYVRGDNLTVSKVPIPDNKTFGVIARYAERIWGGGIPGEPDTLMYSAPFNPLDWEANTAIPEDGAGDVMQPSWDGDSFFALKQIGSQLLAFKRNRIWRIMNTDPSEYVFKEQYGGGTAYANTIAVQGERVLMLGDDSIMEYDGLNAAPFQKEMCEKIFATLNTAALDQACACVFRNSYYCAIPVGTSTYNNAMLIYNFHSGTWLYRDDICVEAFLPTDNKLYFTSHATPGKVYEWGADAWTSGKAVTPARWASQWQDLQYKTIRKGGFEVYLTVESKGEAVLTIGIETENGSKTKTVTFPATTSTAARQKKVTFGGICRRFRLYLESTTATVWRIIGGVQMRIEIDAD